MELNKCEKSRARTERKILTTLDALRRKLENFGPSANKLEETPYIFFVFIVYIPVIVFYCFSAWFNVW